MHAENLKKEKERLDQIKSYEKQTDRLNLEQRIKLDDD